MCRHRGDRELDRLAPAALPCWAVGVATCVGNAVWQARMHRHACMRLAGLARCMGGMAPQPHMHACIQTRNHTCLYEAGRPRLSRHAWAASQNMHAVSWLGHPRAWLGGVMRHPAFVRRRGQWCAGSTQWYCDWRFEMVLLIGDRRWHFNWREEKAVRLGTAA
eukprot:364200-Chlamydomonas_euryale.AAC.4